MLHSIDFAYWHTPANGYVHYCSFVFLVNLPFFGGSTEVVSKPFRVDGDLSFLTTSSAQPFIWDEFKFARQWDEIMSVGVKNSYSNALMSRNAG